MSISNPQVRKERLQKELDRVTLLLSLDRCHRRYKEAFDDTFSQAFNKVQPFLPAHEDPLQHTDPAKNLGAEQWPQLRPTTPCCDHVGTNELSGPGGNLSPEEHDGRELLKAPSDTYAMTYHGE
ncbi:hypothetical protein FVER14953_08609 [Fusarium verticillioides]|nr:hypothetical protein FVER14953_08609 [Fusarium verticillioides]